jgi:WD40 repeat protein
MAPSGLEAAIVRPLEAVGAQAESALVAEMVAAVADQPAALPSLQFTLFELAQRRADRCLTLDDYRALGGVAAAIASRAESLYLSLDEVGRAATRRIFERLVVFGAEGEVTGRRSYRSALANSDGTDVDAVIDRWTAARLLTADVDPRTRVPVVHVAHEALLGTWPRLREWLDEDREAILALDHLQESALSWIELDRDDGALYRGLRLEAALELVEVRGDDITVDEREFLDASSALRAREEQAAADHLRRQERANRRLRIQFAVIAAALVVSLVVGALALNQRGNAVAQRRVAVGRELAAASVANLEDDPERSILLALEAVETTRRDDGSALPEAEDALHRAVGASRLVASVPGVGGRLDWSPTEDVFVTEGVEESGMVDIRNATTGESVLVFRGDDVDVNDVRFSADGTKLAVTGDDGTASVWDPATGEELATFEGGSPAWYPSFSADGSLVATWWLGEDVVRVNDATSGDLVTVLDDLEAGAIDLSPDGRQLLYASQEAAGIVDVRSGETVRLLDPIDAVVGEVAWSPAGDRIATGSWDGAVRIWDPTTGAQVAIGDGGDTEIIGLDWSADGSRVASGGNDGTARVWDVGDGTLTESFRFAAQDLSNGVPGVAFSPDGERLIAADWQITSAKIFDLRPEAAGEVGAFRSPPDSFTVGFTGDGTGLVTGVDDGIFGIWDVEPGILRSTVEGVPSPGFSVSPDGTTVALAGPEGFPITLRDVTTGDALAEFDVQPSGRRPQR